MKIIKKIIKKILRIFGWKLIKIRRRKPISFTNNQPSKELFETMINSNGILHIGAHRGMEAENYNWLNKRVIWIEAIDELFVELNDHIQNYYNQRAYCALIGDKNCIHDFYISNNDAASSSIYNFSEEIQNHSSWKNLKMIKKIKKNMTTLDNFVTQNGIDLNDYNHWVFDVQGSEFKCLQGATDSIKFCKSIHIEISKKKFYQGGVLWKELKTFLEANNFDLVNEPNENHADILFLKKSL